MSNRARRRGAAGTVLLAGALGFVALARCNAAAPTANTQQIRSPGPPDRKALDSIAGDGRGGNGLDPIDQVPRGARLTIRFDRFDPESMTIGPGVDPEPLGVDGGVPEVSSPLKWDL